MFKENDYQPEKDRTKTREMNNHLKPWKDLINETETSLNQPHFSGLKK